MSPETDLSHMPTSEPGISRTPDPSTAAEKLMRTIRELSKPEEDAGELELTVASVCMALESGLGPELEAKQVTGELDEFVLALTRFLALHRSDSAHMLAVVELPRARDLPAATRLHQLDLAIEAGQTASSPL